MTQNATLAGWIEGADASSAFPRGVVRGLEDIEAIEKATPETVLLAATTYRTLKAVTDLAPDKVAIRMMDSSDPEAEVREVTYRRYLARATAAANLFRSHSEGRPSVIAIMLPIVPEALFAAWGGCTSGVIATINPHLEPEMVAAILRQIGATGLVTTTAHGPSAADRLDDIRAAAPELKSVWLVDGPQEVDFSSALDDQTSDGLAFEPSDDAHAGSIFLPTGGTTAAPKLARLNHRGQLLNAWTAGSIMGAAADEVVGVGMPLFHVGGLLMLSLRALVHGQTALLLTPAGFRDPGIVSNFWEISRRRGMTSVIATPTTAAALLAARSNHEGHLIRTMTCGGSTIPVELGRKFHEAFGLHLREVWGATEFHGFLGCMPNETPPVLGSVGLRTPFHDVRAFILDDGNRFIREAAPGEEGVIVGKGPGVCAGYVDPSNDAGFFVQGAPDGEVWGSSGDLGRVDSEGYIWIHGRAKDVIIRGGHNLDPRMIEEVLVSHPAVQLAAAIGQPDRSKGELPIAYVQLLPGQTATVDELLLFCRQHVKERAACPVEVIIVDQMPLTAVGKIFKPDLRLDATRRVAARVAEEVVGSKRLLAVDTPQRTGRPRVVVQICGSLVLDVPALARLKDELGGYHFDVEIRCEPEATAA